MSFADCIDNAIKGGELSERDGTRLRRDFERFRDGHMQGGPGIADELAKKDLLDLIRAENANKRRQAKLALKTLRTLAADITSYRTASGKPDVPGAVALKLENYDTATFSSVTQRTGSVIGEAHAMLTDLLDHFRRDAIGGDMGRHNAAQLPNVVRELFGEGTGDARAKEFAQAFEGTADWLRRRANAAGMAIAKLEKWGLPQHHDARALRKVGRNAWKEYIRPRLDISRMRHPLTGKPVAERDIDGILDSAFDVITTDGWSRREPSRQATGRGALANQRAEQRFLVFRDADAWLEYQRDFGDGDIFHTMMGHISGMSKDIAALEILGPNPTGTVEWLKQAIAKDAANRGVNPKKVESSQLHVETLWKSIRGDLETPVNELMADGFAVARNFVSSAVLGGAALTSIGDVGTGTIARHFAGLKAESTIPQVMQAFTRMERKEAVAAGLILDAASHTLHQQARFAGIISGPHMARYLTDRVLTYSGLLPFTQAGRHAFGLAFMSEAAQRVQLSYSELPRFFRETFERHGITERDWNLIRKARLHTKFDGTQLLRPSEIRAQINDALASRWLEMVQSETEYAVPTGGHRARIAVLGQTRPGTVSGEMMRNFMQFKSFPIAFLFLHGGRIMRMLAADRRSGTLIGAGAAYAASLLITTTLFGGVSLQLKQIAAGKDPRDITDPKFWGAALLQGGALGIYGDFLFSDIDRYGGGFKTTIAGPLADRANQAWQLTGGNVYQLMIGEKPKFGREAAQFIRHNVPGSNIWYLRMAWERVLMDQLQYLADPEANAAFKRQQRQLTRNYGQKFFWQPGQTRPDRAPAASAAISE